MATHDFDLFVIGAGSGGVRASRIAASLGARVAVAEERYLGGTCVNVGCIPKKLFYYASDFGEGFDDAAAFGWSSEPRSHDWKKLIENKDREIARLSGAYERLLKDSGVTILDGRAQLLDAQTVAIDGMRYSAKYILVATGSWPVMPPTPGIEHAISSNEAFHLDTMPQRAVLVGGGYIAVEFAGIFHGLGAQVTLVHRGPLPLTGFDYDLRAVLADEMRKRGIDLRLNSTVERIEKTAMGIRATLMNGDTLDADLIMCATGRRPNTRGFGLENAGVKVNPKGAVAVDEYSRTSVENIYAIGDCTDRIMLTPVAIAEGNAVAQTLFGPGPMKIDYDHVPSTVFSHPNLATVGLTEEAARKRFRKVDVYKSSFRPLKHTLSGRDEMTFMKMVVDAATERVVGCHMVGPDAGEIMQGLALALRLGAKKSDFDATIGIHPTAAEEFMTMRQKWVEPAAA